MAVAQSLLITVRFHEGRYHGEADRVGANESWPPSPARLFQALVAGAARGASLRGEDRRALEWLERLEPPCIVAPPVRHGRAVKRFVPNNDLDAKGGDPARISDIRVPKSWRPCYFDASIPVLFAWRFEGEAALANHVCDMSRRLYQLGRGIDMAWASGQVLPEDEAEHVLRSHPGVLRTPSGSGVTAVPRAGTLDSLVRRFLLNREKLITERINGKSRQLFRQPPKALFGSTGYDSPKRVLCFDIRAPDGGFVPQPLAATVPLLARLRDAAAQRLQRALPESGELYERLIVGRGAGRSDLAQRIRLIAVPSIGTEHTDPSIRRIAVEVPADCPIQFDDLRWAFAGLLVTGVASIESDGRLVSGEDDRMVRRFARSATVFRSITPLAIPAATRRRVERPNAKRPDERSSEERSASASVAQALRHAGIHAQPTVVRVQREPFQRRGIRAERFAEGSRFSKHALWHVELRFNDPVTGPLLIGDGRFAGLGLMVPEVDASRVEVFEIDLAGQPAIAASERPALLRYLRRALMSLARDDMGRVDPLFSGHETDGGPARQGHHGHVFLAADGDADDQSSISRVLIAAPWTVDRGAASVAADRRRAFDTVVRRVKDLRAGPLGYLGGLVPRPVEDGDRTLRAARNWISVAPYTATKHLKKSEEAAEFVRADVMTECSRRGLPAPVGVEVSEARAGPRGGRPVANVKLRFATAVQGPILLGRDSHLGGGLFHRE